jgi:hypothetical protein
MDIAFHEDPGHDQRELDKIWLSLTKRDAVVITATTTTQLGRIQAKVNVKPGLQVISLSAMGAQGEFVHYLLRKDSEMSIAEANSHIIEASKLFDREEKCWKSRIPKRERNRIPLQNVVSISLV